MSTKTSKNSNAKKSTTSASAQPAKAATTSASATTASEQPLKAGAIAASSKAGGRSATAAPKVAPAKASATKAEGARVKARGAAQTAPTAASPATPRPTPDAARDPRLPAIGTVLVKRDRNGRTRCECAVEAEGFRYRGTLHRSLSAAASAAAADLGIKSRVNGFVFWTLVKVARPAKDQAEHLRKIAARYEEQAAALLGQASAAEVRKDVRRNLETHAAQVRDLLAKAAA